VKAKVKLFSRALLFGIFALSGLLATAAVAPHSSVHMEQEATLIVSGKVLTITSKTQKSMHESDLLIARDRIFKFASRLPPFRREQP
jgi:hypothetical protein